MNRCFVAVSALAMTVLTIGACDPGSGSPAGTDLTAPFDSSGTPDTNVGGDAGSSEVSDDVPLGETTPSTTLCQAHEACIVAECGDAAPADGTCIAAAATTCGLGTDPESAAASALLSCQVDNACSLNALEGRPCTYTECVNEVTECRTGGTYGAGTCSDLLSCSQTCVPDAGVYECVRNCASSISLAAHQQSLATEVCVIETCAGNSSPTCFQEALEPGGACASLCP